MTLPPSRLDVEAGDVVRLGADAHVYRVMRVEEDGRREAELTRIATRRLMTAGPTPGVIADVPAALSAPAAAILDLPATPWPGVGGVSFAAFAHPWPGAIVLGAGLDEALVEEAARADQAAGAVETLTALAAGPVGRFDHAASLDVAVWGRDLSSTTQAGLFAGANRLALEVSPGRWSLLQFLSAELIGVGQYRLRGLLRAEGDAITPQTAGFVLDEAVDALDWPASWRGASVAARATAPGLTFSSETAWAGSVTVTPQALVPPAPAHVRAERQPDGAVRLSWMACVRADVDDWGPGAPDAGQDRDRWRVELLDAADTTLSTYESASETLDVTLAQEVAAYGASPHGAWRVRVARWSDAVGWGEAATTDLTLG